jgi:hypothetical protein
LNGKAGGKTKQNRRKSRPKEAEDETEMQKKCTQAASAHIARIPPIPVDHALVNYSGYTSAALGRRWLGTER